MAQAGYRSCSCHGWLYKEDGSEDAREVKDHAEAKMVDKHWRKFMTDFEGYNEAKAMLEQLTTHTGDCLRNRSTDNEEFDHKMQLGSWAPDDEHDTASMILRDVLCCLQHDPGATLRVETNEAYKDEVGYDPTFVYPGSQLSFHAEFNRGVDYSPVERGIYDDIIHLVQTIIAYEYSRDAVTDLAIRYSLCPLHFCDWAICFDDDDPECSQIRIIYPHSHDT